MATSTGNRNKSILAVLLALIAAGSLCVMAVSAAGYTISSPAWETFTAFFKNLGTPQTGGPGGPTSGGPETGGPNPGPRDPDPTSPNGPGDNGGGGGGGDQTCLLGLLCVSADVNTGANTSNERCFLNLLCLSADTQVGANSTNNAVVVPLIEADVDLKDQGSRGDVDVAGSSVIDLDSDVLNLNQGGQTLLPNLLGSGQGGSQNNGCLLGLVCLNLGGN